MDTTGVIKSLQITEKSNKLETSNVYTVIIDPRADKIAVKRAIETHYGVKVVKVNIIHTKKKERNAGRRTVTKRAATKKAMIFLSKTAKPIDFLKLKK